MISDTALELLRENLARLAIANRKFDRYFKNLSNYTTLRWDRGSYRNVRRLESEWHKISISR